VIEEPAAYTVVQRPTDEELRRCEAKEAGPALYIEARAEARARRSGGKAANERAVAERLLLEGWRASRFAFDAAPVLERGAGGW